MSSQRSTKPSKPTSKTAPPRTSSSSSSSLSSHLAMVELKQRILTSLSKLSDRDTHQIAVEDLEKIILSLSNDGVLVLLNCLYDAAGDPKPAVKKEGVRLLAIVCAVHTEPAATHLTKIIVHIVKRLKDSDSQIREACRDAIGSLAGLYLKTAGGGGGGGDGVMSLFVKPLFEVMNENNKAAQDGAALCLAKMVECASDPPSSAFQKLCTRVCKYLNSPNFMAKASLLQVVSSLSQVGVIAPPQSLEPLLQSIHKCLSSSDWATRKAAADTLTVISSNTENITAEVAASTVIALEASRFDKVKPVRESMTEALQLWKEIAGKRDGSSDENKASSHDGDNSESAVPPERKDQPSSGDRESEKSVKDSPRGLSPTDPNSKGKGKNILDKAVGILKKKAPGLTDKELNPEFFQKLETRVSDDLPVEVVLPRRRVDPSNPRNEDLQLNADRTRTGLNCQAADVAFKPRNESMERRGTGDYNQRDPSNAYPDFSRTPGQSEGFMNNKGNWMAIQRQLLLLERQQAHLMNMLQDFMGGSHDSMVTLEDRVRGLERVVEDMVRDMSISSRFEGPANSRSLGKYNGFPDYSGSKHNGRIHIGERFSASTKLRELHYGKSAKMAARRGAAAAPMGGRRAWEKGFEEGPSARSVWQAAKDEATLEAIRVAGEDNGGITRAARVAMPETTAEVALGNEDPVWTAWSNAMDALDVGDLDTAFAHILSVGDDVLLVKLMERSGPAFDHLSVEVANELLNAISQLLISDHDFCDMFLYWIQQLADIVTENGADALGIPMEVKREILLNLQEMEHGEGWEGSPSYQVLVQLASGWEMDLQNLLAK